MYIQRNNVAYIDSANLYMGCKAEGLVLDYHKFRVFLYERYGVTTAYVCIGYVPGNEERYKRFQEQGYTLIFKPTVVDGNGKIKGNCDAELVLTAVKDYYENTFDKVVIVSSDGDFGCLIQFLQEKRKLEILISPTNKSRCSSLLKRLASRITFLPEVRNLVQKI